MSATVPAGRDEPEQDDLSLVLKRLMSRESSTRKTPESRRRLANSPLTREYLEAGYRLLTEQFSPAEPRSGEGDDELKAPSLFFSWLSAQKVIDEVTRGGKLRGNQGTFEDRWPYRDYFVEDLLAYSLWVKHWSERIDLSREMVKSQSSYPDFDQAVQETLYRACRAANASTSARLWLIVSAIIGRYPELMSEMGQVRVVAEGALRSDSERIFADRGLRLRPGVTPENLAIMISALITGVSMRINTDPDPAAMIDDQRRTSLLGDAVLALLAGCIDAGDGKTVAELVNSLTMSSSA
jgi:hypothetical protein